MIIVLIAFFAKNIQKTFPIFFNFSFKKFYLPVTILPSMFRAKCLWFGSDSKKLVTLVCLWFERFLVPKVLILGRKSKTVFFYTGQFTKKNKKSCLSQENKICLKKNVSMDTLHRSIK